ncbi:hypothetical protein [Candidatus Reidiella endopervernicosa]|uniref:GNAT family N-acetyltransferase n=1 Tax=Candidatus Reidiella endopervernicosa TaxID=2738883 RepID=A0A6N0HSQ9_9GAMM|nr:hypothetical protein [Candidatus Reidiella endopervernicosa]QKQ25247.1 hypothetical protein HUE57_02275 [Candidatus Reidiella endopervernicosa]
MELEIRTAQQYDCFAIAELALMAGEGIPAHFWESGRTGDEPIEAVGARNAASEDENFSYRNAHLALIDGKVAGMLLAYRLPASEESDDLNDLPEFIRPLVELEKCVPDSFYINMVASYPEFRSQGSAQR